MLRMFSGIMRPYAATTNTSGLKLLKTLSASALLRETGCSTGSPAAWAVTFYSARCKPVAPSACPVWLGVDTDNLAAAVDQGLQMVRREFRRPGKEYPHLFSPLEPASSQVIIPFYKDMSQSDDAQRFPSSFSSFSIFLMSFSARSFLNCGR